MTLVQIPPARLQWEGLGYYNDGFTRSETFEVELVSTETTVTIGGHELTREQVDALYIDLSSATLAQVTQGHRRTRVHPLEISTEIKVCVPVEGGDDLEIPAHHIPEVIEWLRFVLGYRLYDGRPEEWEY